MIAAPVAVFLLYRHPKGESLRDPGQAYALGLYVGINALAVLTLLPILIAVGVVIFNPQVATEVSATALIASASRIVEHNEFPVTELAMRLAFAASGVIVAFIAAFIWPYRAAGRVILAAAAGGAVAAAYATGLPDSGALQTAVAVAGIVLASMAASVAPRTKRLPLAIVCAAVGGTTAMQFRAVFMEVPLTGAYAWMWEWFLLAFLWAIAYLGGIRPIRQRLDGEATTPMPPAPQTQPA